MANLNIKTALVGGTVNCLDRNTPSMKVNGSVCWVMVSGVLLCYKFDSSSLVAADGVNSIIPYGNTAETAGRWILFPTKYLSNPQSPDSFTFTADGKGLVFSDGSSIKRSAGQGVRFYPANDNYPLLIFDASGENLQLSLRPPENTVALAGTSNTDPITPANLDYVLDSRVGVANAADVKTALNASGDAPIYSCRAWVQFNGSGTPSRTGYGNVSSITDRGTGLYTVNLITAMPDTAGAILSGVMGDASEDDRMVNVEWSTTSAIKVATATTGTTHTDMSQIHIGVIR